MERRKSPGGREQAAPQGGDAADGEAEANGELAALKEQSQLN
jgi:hypothetical protein